MNGFDYHNNVTINGTQDFYADSIQLGDIGDLELYLNNLELQSGTQGPVGPQGTGVIFNPPILLQLQPDEIPYIGDTVTTNTINGVTTNTHSLVFGINKGATGPIGLPGEDGKDGKDGLDGAPGLPGAPGLNGAPGLPGADGADGKDASVAEMTGIATGISAAGIALHEATVAARFLVVSGQVLVIEGQIGTIGSQVNVLQQTTQGMTRNSLTSKTSFTNTSLTLSDGVSDTITMSSIAGSINSKSMDTPTITVLNINPKRVNGDDILNIGTNDVYNNINLGKLSNLNINANVYFKKNINDIENIMNIDIDNDKIEFNNCDYTFNGVDKVMTVNTELDVNNNLKIIGNTYVDGTIDISGNSNIIGGLIVVGNVGIEGMNTTLIGNLVIDGDSINAAANEINLNGNMDLSGDIVFTGNLTINTNTRTIEKNVSINSGSGIVSAQGAYINIGTDNLLSFIQIGNPFSIVKIQSANSIEISNYFNQFV